METLFTDGFESGNLSKWSTKSGITAQQSIVATGNWAARGASTGSSAAYARAGLGRSLSEVYATTRFRIVSQGANDVTVLTLTTSGNTPIVSLVVTSGGTLGLRRTGSSSVITSSTTVTKGVWHVLQLRAKVNGSSGETEVWLDGVRIGTLSRTLNLGTARFARIEIGERSKTRKFDLVWDDVTATTGPIAVAAVAGIERLAPTASATPFPTATSTVPPIPAPSASATATPTEPPATSTPVPTATSTATEAPPPIVSPVPTETPIPTDTPVIEANRPPVAFAGVDQVLALEDGETQVVAVLDGTASWDPDGEIIAYEWYGIDDFLATGPRLELPLGPGSHIIYLVVRDNDGDYAPDDLTITVLDHRSTGSSATPSASP